MSFMNSARQGEAILGARDVDVGEQNGNVGMFFKPVEGFVGPTRFIGRAAGVLEGLAGNPAEHRFVIVDEHAMLTGLLMSHGS